MAMTVTREPAVPPALGTVAALRCRGLRKRFGLRQAVDGIGFEIAPGETYGLLGPNGAGKTTTISMICGILARDEGEVFVAGEPLDVGVDACQAPGGARAPGARDLPRSLRAREPRLLRPALRHAREALRPRIGAVLEVVGPQRPGRERTAGYSGGMKRRLNIAIGLLHRPRLLVLDEPTVGVDPQSRNAILASVEALGREGMAILYTTHYMEEAERLCDRVGIIDEGRIVAEGTRAELVRTGRRDGLASAWTPTGDIGQAAEALRALQRRAARPPRAKAASTCSSRKPRRCFLSCSPRRPAPASSFARSRSSSLTSRPCSSTSRARPCGTDDALDLGECGGHRPPDPAPAHSRSQRRCCSQWSTPLGLGARVRAAHPESTSGVSHALRARRHGSTDRPPCTSPTVRSVPSHRRESLTWTMWRPKRKRARFSMPGAAGAVVVIPAGFSQAIASGAPTQVRLLGGEYPASFEVARSVVTGSPRETGAAQLLVATRPRRPVTEHSSSRRPARGPAPPPIAVVEAIPPARQAGRATFYAAAMAIMFVFFATQYGALAIHADRQGGTLARHLAAPVTAGAILLGATLASLVLGMLAMTVLVLGSSLVAHATWGAGAAGRHVASFAGVFAASGISMLVSTIAQHAAAGRRPQLDRCPVARRHRRGLPSAEPGAGSRRHAVPGHPARLVPARDRHPRRPHGRRG